MLWLRLVLPFAGAPSPVSRETSVPGSETLPAKVGERRRAGNQLRMLTLRSALDRLRTFPRHDQRLRIEQLFEAAAPRRLS
jgi:hypothetical protein